MNIFLLKPKPLTLKPRQGFTLVELMVTIAILGIVVVMIGNLTNFTVGRLKSNQLKHTNDAIRSALNLIGQKMNNANAHKNIGGTKVYGFYENGDLLTILSSDSTDTPTCTYFGKKNDKIMMGQDSGCSSLATSDLLTNDVTSSKIFVEEFELTTVHMMTGTGWDKIPEVKIKVKAYDKSDPAATNTELKTTFTMDGENVKYLNNL
jgi:prepilin-type N-terminal cleavage/methylation domain-containing protein